MNTITIDATRVWSRLPQHELQSLEKEIKQAKETLTRRTGKGNEFLGWLDLPACVDNEMMKRIKSGVSRLQKMSELMVVVGIGGSYLGARAVIEALQTELRPKMMTSNETDIVYAGHTLSESYYSDLLKLLDKKDYTVTVISKSGTTTEPAVAFRILRHHLEQKYGQEGARKRIVAITDAEKGALHQLAKTEGYPMYVIPDNVGGRYSVLTPVGLLPIAMAGYDIDKLIEGANSMRDICLNEGSLSNNPALMYAALRNGLYRKGKKVEMLVSFEPRLRYISEWWKQLYGESEGKGGVGILPHSLIYTTDLHSMGQYVQDGERLMFETLLHIDENMGDVKLPTDEANLDGINYLVTKTLTDINHAAEEGTTKAHEDGGVPVVKINMPAINEYYVGQLLYMFEFACGVSGYTLGVNPFDQPGVEAYKKNMFELLGKPK